MKRLYIALILLAGSIFIIGLAGATDNTFGTKNLPQDSNREKPDGYICQPSYSGDCANRPSGSYCIVYSDGYIWAIPDTPARGVWDKAGSWHGHRVEVIHGKKADYYHVLGTSLASIAEPSAKENYESSGSNYNATQPRAAAYQPQAPNQPQVPNETQSQVALTIDVHEGDFNGIMLPGVQIAGQDAAGNGFEGVTDSNGSAIIEGQPGTWKFSFAKDGYEPLDLNYDVTQADEAAAYLQIANQNQALNQSQTLNQNQPQAMPQTLNQPQSQPQSQVALTIDVHEGDFNGTMLPGVQIAGQDAVGNSFEGITDSNGAAVIKGQPGAWKFSFAKDGYEPLDLNYNVTQTDEAAVYLQRANQTQALSPSQAPNLPQAISQPQNQVALTVYVHEGDLNGTLLSGVQITGQDAAGNSFEGLTDSNGLAIIEGQPGAWKFSFAKEGYQTLNLNYNVTQNDEAAAYLQRADTQPSAQQSVPEASIMSA